MTGSDSAQALIVENFGDKISASEERSANKWYSAYISNLILEFISIFTEKLDINWRYKKVLYSQDINQFNKLVIAYDIKTADGDQISINILRDSSAFKKSILIKVHPDKGGNKEDFDFCRN